MNFIFYQLATIRGEMGKLFYKISLKNTNKYVAQQTITNVVLCSELNCSVEIKNKYFEGTVLLSSCSDRMC